MEPVLVTVNRAAELLSVGRTRVFALIGTGELDSIKVGGSRRIPTAAIQRYVDAQLQEQSVA